jgi:mannitol/fructose-specific phosphotransferase system IIA component (Ntr-type)
VLLAQLAQLFSDAELVAALRRARNSAELYALLAGWQERQTAA